MNTKSNKKNKFGKFKSILARILSIVILAVLFSFLLLIINISICLIIDSNIKDFDLTLWLMIAFIVSFAFGITVSIIMVVSSNNFGKYSMIVNINWPYFLMFIILSILLVLSVYYSPNLNFNPDVNLLSVEWGIFAITIALLVLAMQQHLSNNKNRKAVNPDDLFGLQRIKEISKIYQSKSNFVLFKVCTILIVLNAISLTTATGSLVLGYGSDRFIKFIFILSFYLTTNAMLVILTHLISNYFEIEKSYFQQPSIKRDYDVNKIMVESAFEEAFARAFFEIIDRDSSLSSEEKERKKNEYVDILKTIRSKPRSKKQKTNKNEARNDIKSEDSKEEQ